MLGIWAKHNAVAAIVHTAAYHIRGKLYKLLKGTAGAAWTAMQPAAASCSAHLRQHLRRLKFCKRPLACHNILDGCSSCTSAGTCLGHILCGSSNTCSIQMPRHI